MYGNRIQLTILGTWAGNTAFVHAIVREAKAKGESVMNMKELVESRQRPYNYDMAAFLYALRDSGITNMAGAGKYLRAEGYWDYLELSPSEANDIVAQWEREVEAGGMEADPTVTQELYDESVEDIEVYRGDLEDL
jgi:hypothetical protein